MASTEDATATTAAETVAANDDGTAAESNSVRPSSSSIRIPDLSTDLSRFSGLSDWISFFRKRCSRIDATHFPPNIARGCSVMIYIAPFVYLLETLFPITDPHLFNFSYFHSPNYAKNCVCDLIDDHLAGF